MNLHKHKYVNFNIFVSLSATVHDFYDVGTGALDVRFWGQSGQGDTRHGTAPNSAAVSNAMQRIRSQSSDATRRGVPWHAVP